MRVLAIGGTGFIGRRAVARLLGGGHEVTVLHRGLTDPVEPPGARSLLADRESVADLRRAVLDVRPDVVLDLAAYTAGHGRTLADACRGSVGRVVVASSADVYRNHDGLRGRASAPPDPAPLSEDAPLRETRHPYRGAGLPEPWADEYEKILVVEEARKGGAPVTVLRLPAVYGPGDRSHRLAPWVRRMADGRPAILMDRRKAAWRWTRGYVGNVAAAVARATVDPRAAGRTYNVGDAVTPTEREWLEAVAEAAGWKGEVVLVPRERLPGPLREPFDFHYHLATDTRRIRRELGPLDPVPRAEALAAAVAWELDEGHDGDPAVYAAEDAVLQEIAGG